MGSRVPGHGFLVLVPAMSTAPMLQRHQLTRRKWPTADKPVGFVLWKERWKRARDACIFCLFVYSFGQSDMGEIP